MALSKTVEFNGITVPDAYIKVSGLTIHAGNASMAFRVVYMASPDAKEFDSSHPEAPYQLDGDNPIKQAYDYLKTLEKFQGSQDC